MKLVSSSELGTYNTCTKQHELAYTRELEPVIMPLHIRRGEVGHRVLETYYERRVANDTHIEATAQALDLIIGHYLANADYSDFEYIDMLSDLQKLMTAYFKYYENDSFKIIGIESTYSTEITHGLHFGGILDLIVELTKGPNRGEIQIWDHKFVNNFKTDDDLKFDVQIPRYIKTLRANNINVRRAIFNQIRYRKMKDPKPEDLFRRSPLMMNSVSIDNVWKETEDTIREIDIIPNVVRRNIAFNTCKHCFFKDICMAELSGIPTDKMESIQYRKRLRPLQEWAIAEVEV